MSHKSCEDPSEPILVLRLIRYLVLPKLQPTYKAPENDYLDECRRHERQENLGRRQPGTGFSSEAEPCDSLDAKTIFASSRVCRITNPKEMDLSSVGLATVAPTKRDATVSVHGMAMSFTLSLYQLRS